MMKCGAWSLITPVEASSGPPTRPEQAIRVGELLPDLELVVALRDGKRHRLARCLESGGKIAGGTPSDDTI